MGEGLSDLKDALVQCNETYLVEDLVKFITSLISCTESGCGLFKWPLYKRRIQFVVLYVH